MTTPTTTPITLAGHPVLRTPADPVTPAILATPEFKELVKLMVVTMRAAPGVGLAAPQIGVGLRVIVLEDGDTLMSRLKPADRALRERTPFPLTVIVNPVLERTSDERATFFEGCLSVPGYMALVERDLAVTVTGLDGEGAPFRWEARGWPARILQHEVDHLNGTLYVDRMLSRTFGANEEVASRWLSVSPEAARQKLGA